MVDIIKDGVHVGPRPSYRKPRLPQGPAGRDVTVNGEVITRAEIEAEAQNHPAESPGEALKASARALAVRALLLQEARAQRLEPAPELDAMGRRETAEDALVRQLLEREISVPTADEAACRRYFENNRRRLAAYLEASSWSRAVAQYIGILAGAAEITGVTLAGADSPLVQ